MAANQKTGHAWYSHSSTLARVLGALIILLLATVKAQAHRDDYLDETIVYLTLEKAEVEAEYWFDYGRDHAESVDFSRHHIALEWGITDHWMVDGRGTLLDEQGDGATFDSGRIETRYRFAEEGSRIVDIACSMELNWERADEGKTIPGIEPRLILSKDFREKLNLTLNLSEEIPLKSESPSFLIAAGIRYNWTDLLRVGCEWHQNATDGGGSIIPQVWFALPSDLTIKLGYSAGYGQVKDDFSRLALEYEF